MKDADRQVTFPAVTRPGLFLALTLGITWFFLPATPSLFAISTQAEIYSTLLSVTAILLVVIIWGPERLIREPEVPGRHVSGQAV